MGFKTRIAVAALSLGVIVTSGAPSALSHQLTETTSAEHSLPVTAPTSAPSSTATDRAHSDRTDKAHAVAKRAEKQAWARSAKNYTFSVRDRKGRPGRWNPCSTIPIVVNTAHAPKHALRDLRTAVAHVNEASGLHFVITGTTHAHADENWGLHEWSGAPGRWAPVLIAFVKPGTGGLTDGGESGVASPVWVGSAGHEVFVSGSIVFNYKQSSWYSPGYGKGLYRGALFEHELGHLAGLDHTRDKTQVMYPEIGRAKTYGSGDLNGLSRLGEGGCLPAIDPEW